MAVSLTPAQPLEPGVNDLLGGILLALIAGLGGVRSENADSLLALDLMAISKKDIPLNP